MADGYDRKRREDVAHICALRQITPVELCIELEDAAVDRVGEGNRTKRGSAA